MLVTTTMLTYKISDIRDSRTSRGNSFVSDASNVELWAGTGALLTLQLEAILQKIQQAHTWNIISQLSLIIGTRLSSSDNYTTTAALLQPQDVFYFACTVIKRDREIMTRLPSVGNISQARPKLCSYLFLSTIATWYLHIACDQYAIHYNGNPKWLPFGHFEYNQYQNCTCSFHSRSP